MNPTEPPAAPIRHASQQTARLVAVEGAGVGQKWVLRGAARIGRSLDCEVVVADPKVSREHAVVYFDEGDFVLEDLGSANGTMVGGTAVDRAVLRFGDRFQVGPNQVFLLTVHDPVEEQLLQRQRLETLGRLTAGVAHDLNNMLGAVKASATFLRELHDKTGPEAAECLADIDRATDRAAEMAAQLLSFARERVAREATNLSSVCLDAVRLARRTFERTITVDATVRPGIFIDGDASQLYQVVMNLLVNARDAVGHQGQITVTLAGGAGSLAVLTVTDDGHGMDPGTQERIFEPFFTTKREGVGFGVGLATVRDILTGHGGAIEVDSAVGRGSTFRITLPAIRPQDRRFRQRTARNSGGWRKLAGKGQRVILVDDEIVLQRSLARVLRRSGYEVEPYANGEDALARIDAQPLPDLVVLDLDLPGMRGQDVLRELRRRGMYLPVICISGHRDALDDDEETAREIAAFLPKPFEPDALLRVIEEALSDPSSPEDHITLTS